MSDTGSAISSEEKTRVGFPEAPEKKRGFNFKTFLVFVLILLLIGGGAWYLFGRTPSEEISEDMSPTPTEEVSEETPTPTEEANVNKEDLKIQILNGSGISGAAGKLQDALKKLGFADFELGNADNYSYKATEVTFDTSVPESVKDEIVTELEKLYSSVSDTSKKLDKYDITIVIGLPKGYSPTVTSRPRTSVTVTPTGTQSTTSTITPTKTPTPTPTP